MRIPLTITLITLVFVSIAAGASETSSSVSVQVTTPQRYSVSIGVSGSNWGSLFGSDSGILLRIELGLSGIKLHVGRRGTFNFLMLPMTSV